MTLSTDFRHAMRLAPPLELKFAGSETGGEITGYASVFGGAPDSYGDVIAAGAFKRTLAEHREEGSLPVMLWSHDPAAVIGRWVEMREDDTGLFVRGIVNLESSRGRDAHAHLKQGDVSGLSIGYVLPEHGFRRRSDGGRILTEVHLGEVSVVALPSQRRARVLLGSKRELEDLLHKSGLPRAAAVRLADGGWSALASQPDPQQQAAAAAQIMKAAARLKGSK
jgi:HK97 family phage prohead protease